MTPPTLAQNAAARAAQLQKDFEELSISNAENELLNFVTVDDRMKRLKQEVIKLANTDINILILGEPGVGKETIARALRGERNGDFIEVNASGIPDTMVEAEFFGAKKGAYTDCREDRNGYFQRANNGVLFLDEISEMPLHLQCKLLRITQKQKERLPGNKVAFGKRDVLRFQQLGSEEILQVNVRIVSASNQLNLAKSKSFRADLYSRLAGHVLRITPLRERRHDIPVLVKHYDKEGVIPAAQIEEWQNDTEHFDFPGNVRDLVNMIEVYKALNK